MKTIRYNPVTKNGTFKCSGFGKISTFRAIDITQAKWKFGEKHNLIADYRIGLAAYRKEVSNVLRKIKIEIVEPTQRKYK